MSCLYYPVKKQEDLKGVIYQNTFYSTSPTVGRKGILIPFPKKKIPVNNLLFYLPLQQKTNKAQTGQQVSFVNGAAFNYTLFDAVKCLNIPAAATYAYIRTKLDTPLNKAFTLSFHAQIYHTQKSTETNLISINNLTACIRVLSNNIISFGIYNEGQAVSKIYSRAISNLIWHCIQVTFDGVSEVSCYIDNALIGTKTLPLSFDTLSVLLNISALGNKGFAGNLAGIRIYNAVLTESQLKSLCNLFRGLYTFVPLKNADIPPVNTKGILVTNKKPFYKINPIAVSTAKQVFYCSGQSTEATTQLTTVGLPLLLRILGIPCIHSSDNVLLYNNTVTFTADKGFTLSAYVYSDYGTGNMAFLSVGCFYQRLTILLFVENDQLKLYQQYSNPDNLRCAMPRNKWVHVAAVYSGDTTALYLEGNLVGSIRSNGQWTTCRGVCLFGNFSNSWNTYPRDAYFKGALADVRLFNTLLSQALVQLLSRTFIQDTAVKVFIPIKADPDKYPTDNLVLYHPLDEALTTLPTLQTVYNQIVQCHTVLNNIPCKFFGGNSFITLNDPTLSHVPVLSKYDCTITFWAKSCGSIGRLLDFGQDTSGTNNNKICIFWRDGKQLLGIKGNYYWQSNIILDPNKWYFYCLTYSAATGLITLKVADSQDIVTSNWITSNWTTNNFLSIGALRTYLSLVWIGFMAGLRIYDRILPAADIKALSTLFSPDYKEAVLSLHTLSDSSLVLYADMKKADKIPTGQTVTINGYLCYRTIDNIPCFWFGADTRYDLTTLKLPTGYTAFTVSAWFYTSFDDLRSWQNIWNMGDSNRSRYRNSQFYIYSNRTVGPHFGSGDYQNFAQSSNKYQWQKWQHAVMTYDKRIAKFYINGYLLLYSNYRALNLNTVLFNMGTEPGNTRDSKYKGYIADVRVYNRAITLELVNTLYNMHKDAVLDKNLLFHLKCDSFKALTGQDVIKYNRGNYTVNLVTQDGIPAYQFPSGNSYNCAVILETYNFPYGDNVPFTVAAWSKLPEKPTNWLGVFGLGRNSSSWLYSQQLCMDWYYTVQRFKFCCYDIDKRDQLDLFTSWDYRPSWYHILATYDGSILSVYTNNVLTILKALNLHVDPRYMMLGRPIHDSNFHYKNGFISDVRVYNKSLSKALATLVYNYQKPTDVALLYTKQGHLIIHTPLDGFMPRQALTGQQYTPVKYRPYPQKNKRDCLLLTLAMLIPDNTSYTKISVFFSVYLLTSTLTVNILSVGDLQLNMVNGLLSLTKGSQTFSMKQVFLDGWEALSLVSNDLKTFDLYLGTYKVLSATYAEALSTFEFVFRKAL